MNTYELIAIACLLGAAAIGIGHLCKLAWEGHKWREWQRVAAQNRAEMRRVISNGNNR